jgi:hypothetical protein
MSPPASIPPGSSDCRLDYMMTAMQSALMQ